MAKRCFLVLMSVILGLSLPANGAPAEVQARFAELASWTSHMQAGVQLPSIPASRAVILDCGPAGFGFARQTSLGFQVDFVSPRGVRSPATLKIEKLVPVVLDREVPLHAVDRFLPEPYKQQLADCSRRVSSLLNLAGPAYEALPFEPSDSLCRFFQPNASATTGPTVLSSEAELLLATFSRLLDWPASWTEELRNPRRGIPFETQGIDGHRRVFGDEDPRFAKGYLVWWLESAFPTAIGGLERSNTTMHGEYEVPRVYSIAYQDKERNTGLEVNLQLGKPGRIFSEDMLARIRMGNDLSRRLFVHRGELMMALVQSRRSADGGKDLYLCSLQVFLTPDALLDISHTPPFNGQRVEHPALALELADVLDFDRLRGFCRGDPATIHADLQKKIEEQKRVTREIQQRHQPRPH